jgi:hypothetical protein
VRKDSIFRNSVANKVLGQAKLASVVILQKTYYQTRFSRILGKWFTVNICRKVGINVKLFVRLNLSYAYVNLANSGLVASGASRSVLI